MFPLLDIGIGRYCDFSVYVYLALISVSEPPSITLIKRPARDACLCMGELPAPPAPAAPPAPHFVFLITL